jgi:two-component system sensor histidine kinase MprB
VSAFSTQLTLRARITVLVAAAVGIAIALTATVVFFVVRSEMYGQFDEDLLRRTKAVGQAVADPDEITRVPVELLGNAQVGALRSDNVMFPAQGSQTPPSSPAELAVAQGTSQQSVRGATVNGESLRIASVPVGSGWALVIAESTEPVDGTLHDLELILLSLGLVGVVTAAVVGYAVARAGLRPVGELTAAAERIARTEDLTPMEVRSNDEIGRLAQSFNTMLATLDAARERERRLVADAGHELRTPLTSIRTNLDLLAQTHEQGVDLPADERAALLTDVREQIRELGELVGDLMQLSKGGVDTSEEFGSVNLSDILNRAVERVQRRAPNVSFIVDADPWWVIGDPTTLERAVTNLLDNAAKWSPPEGEVRVALRDGQLTVTDDGPGISEAERTRVFERFYRSPDARGLPGSGLGLAMVAQTAQDHGGNVQASAAPSGGALLVLTLPGSPLS